MRFTDPSNHEVTNPEARRALVTKIAAEHPDALLLSGDLPYNGATANDYVVYHSETAAWSDEKLRVFPLSAIMNFTEMKSSNRTTGGIHFRS